MSCRVHRHLVWKLKVWSIQFVVKYWLLNKIINLHLEPLVFTFLLVVQRCIYWTPFRRACKSFCFTATVPSIVFTGPLFSWQVYQLQCICLSLCLFLITATTNKFFWVMSWSLEPLSHPVYQLCICSLSKVREWVLGLNVVLNKVFSRRTMKESFRCMKSSTLLQGGFPPLSCLVLNL